MTYLKKYKGLYIIICILIIINILLVNINNTYANEAKKVKEKINIDTFYYDNTKENTHYLNIVFSNENALMENFVKFITNCNYNHVAFALDNNLSEIYSFVGYKNNKTNCYKTGFNYRSIADYPNDTLLSIITLKISNNDYNNIKQFISDTYYDETATYNYSLILPSIFKIKIGINNNNDYICCTFVAKILSLLDNNIINKNHNLYSIKDVYNLLLRQNIQPQNSIKQ